MLPAAPPQLDWLDIAGWSLPASEVGGDYYDYFELGDGKIALVSADVAGHGLASGVVLAALRAGLMLLRQHLADPASVLRRLDELILETSRRRMLVTAVIVLIDRDAQRAVIASAGHPPVIVRRGDGTAEVIELYAPPIGSRLTRMNETREIAFAPGDLLVLHTDGVYEAERGDGEIYGLDRLAASIASTRADDSAAAVCNRIVHDLALFRATMPQHDDVTLVAARMRARD
jgi:sigma-B regulation protein RsbU (phosphoserine phosphatase)